jgi:hypothetical protein
MKLVVLEISLEYQELRKKDSSEVRDGELEDDHLGD